MRCPFCHFADTRVVDTRSANEGTAIRRRRECPRCGRRFTTFERVEELPLVVIKKDGRRELFDRAKILSGCLRACHKRPVRREDLENLVDEVERELRNRLEPEIPSYVIGELVMEKLKRLDEVAYVRFASVYREFRDSYDFKEEIERLAREKEGEPDVRSDKEA
ncbi:transcriptional regulator NrdR [Ammonifex thiophilus]|uniref:Transcriptional repressor NrdR n=1 Tax=Ammonifex thiophilus TaxID=444093 RepID=A0A3D8P533_9THEO|nr:transcriptional regulator NrdR [Ammonifex thiophilus]RDV82916.1 transcriptional repressor NrdR [Ammonifex thiophilus]